MKVLTKELNDDIELHEIFCAVDSREKRTLPLIFLNGSHDGVADSDINVVKTRFNISDKENELHFIMLPATFTFSCEHNFMFKKDKHEPEEDFLQEYANRLRLIAQLPEEILSRVKDKRLLALGYAEKDVKKDIIKYTKARKTAALKVLKKSLDDSVIAAEGLTIENQFGKFSLFYSVAEMFERATVKSVIRQGNDLCFELSNNENFVLTDVRTLEEEIKPDNTFISQFELYRAGQRYELHFLLMTRDCNYVEHFHYVTYSFKDMKYWK